MDRWIDIYCLIFTIYPRVQMLEMLQYVPVQLSPRKYSCLSAKNAVAVSLVMNAIIPTMNYLSNRELSVPESHPPQECPPDQLKQGSGRPLGQILGPLNHPHLLFMTELAETGQLFALCLCCVPHCSPMEITPRHASQQLAPGGQRSVCAHLTLSGGPACCCSSFLNG